VCLNNLFDLSDGALIQKETLDWLAKYVKKDPDVDTGPQFQWVDQRGQWYSAAKYPVEPGTPLTAALSGQTNLPVIPYLGGSGLPFIPIATPALNAVNLTLPAATTTTYLVGAPKLTLTYSGTGTVNHVYAQLVDDSTGFVLGYLATPIPVQLDGQTHDVTVDLEPVSYTLAPGQSVTLQLVSSAGQYQTIVPSFGSFTVSGMQVSVPTADPASVTTTSSV
jgi:ABC-2 type transport system ATP-binding protein